MPETYPSEEPELTVEELRPILLRAFAENRELRSEIKIRDGVISDLQNRLAAYEFPDD